MNYLSETLRFHDFCLKIMVNSEEQSVDVICRIACSLGNNLLELRRADVGVVVSEALLPKALSSAVIWEADVFHKSKTTSDLIHLDFPRAVGGADDENRSLAGHELTPKHLEMGLNLHKHNCICRAVIGRLQDARDLIHKQYAWSNRSEMVEKQC